MSYIDTVLKQRTLDKYQSIACEQYTVKTLFGVTTWIMNHGK